MTIVCTTTAPEVVQPAKRPSGRIPELDGLRGLAILFVLIYHCASYEPARHSLGWYLMLPRHPMWSGVDLFFVLSGLLIGGILLDNRGSNQYFQAFYARRMFRIFPLYYGLILLSTVGALLWPHSPLFTSGMPLWAFPLFVQNIVCAWVFTMGSAWTGATWSLAVEEQFYLVLPVVIRHLRRESVTAFALACVVAAPLLRILLISRGAVFTQVYPLIFCRTDALAYGVLAAVIVRSDRARSWIKAHKRIWLMARATAIAGTASTYKWASFQWVGTMGYSFVDALYFLLILSVLTTPPGWLHRRLKSAPLLWLGSISYAAYLFHSPVLMTLFEVTMHRKPLIDDAASLGLTVTGLAITLALAQLSRRWLEQPLISHAHTKYKYNAT